jgi:hypothetical protein
VVKIGLGLPNVIPGTEGRRLVGWAQRAEELGFDSLGVIDRVVYDSYEPLLALAMAAAVTERIELVTNVVIAPLRNTGMLAKQAASLDRASGGRLTLGLALGARDDDFVACGLPTGGAGCSTPSSASCAGPGRAPTSARHPPVPAGPGCCWAATPGTPARAPPGTATAGR